MFDVKSLSLENAKKVLQQVRVYQDMNKKLGKRGRVLFHHHMNETHTYLVEYFPAVGIEFTKEKALEIYKKVFLLTPKIEDIHFVPKEHLLSGLKVYCDDNCIDLSFKNIEYKLNK